MSMEATLRFRKKLSAEFSEYGGLMNRNERALATAHSVECQNLANEGLEWDGY